MLSLDLNSYMTDMVYELVPNVKKHGNELVMKCPICGDSTKKRSLKRGHWYINEGMYYCFNGGCPAGDGHGMHGIKFLSALAHKTTTEIKAELIQRATKYNNISNNNLNTVKVANVKTFNTKSIDNLFDDNNKKEINIINNMILDNKWTEKLPNFLNLYLKKRKIELAPYLNKDFKFYYDKQYNRLVIPWSNEYYQERALTKKDEENYGKYVFPPNTNKSIFGLENINQNFKYIFLLEGVFDSIFVKNGVAVGGLTLSNSQKELLLPYQKDFKIVIFMDNQWCDNSSYQKTIKILKNNPFTDIFIWPSKLKDYKDVNETIIESDNCIRLWSNEKFLISRIFKGPAGTLELMKK